MIGHLTSESSVIFQARMANIVWLHPLKCDDLYFICMILKLLSLGIGLCEIIMEIITGIFHYFNFL